MKTERFFFEGIDRYAFDFDVCSSKEGFAQIDTEQDAWYHGIWANPETKTIISYVEGDVAKQTAETDGAFVKAIKALKDVYKTVVIDCGFDSEMKRKFVSMGLANMVG